jgi:hypothetical protein
MLGSLFDGDEEFYGNVGNSVSYKYRSSEEYSVSGRQESGFVGLENQYASFYSFLILEAQHAISIRWFSQCS